MKIGFPYRIYFLLFSGIVILLSFILSCKSNNCNNIVQYLNDNNSKVGDIEDFQKIYNFDWDYIYIFNGTAPLTHEEIIKELGADCKCKGINENYNEKYIFFLKNNEVIIEEKFISCKIYFREMGNQFDIIKISRENSKFVINSSYITDNGNEYDISFIESMK